jgi:hypothetical protein
MTKHFTLQALFGSNLHRRLLHSAFYLLISLGAMGSFLLSPSNAESPSEKATNTVSPAGEAPSTVTYSQQTDEFDKLKWSTNFQAWFFNDTSATVGKPNFRIRRAELRVAASPLENFKFFGMLDAAKLLDVSVPAGGGAADSTRDTRVLQLLGISYRPIELVEFSLGQLIIQTTNESFDRNWELWFTDRAVFTRLHGDQWQPGFQIAFRHDLFYAAGMISNGGAANTQDTNDSKDVSLRAEFTPLGDVIRAGTFFKFSDFSLSTQWAWGAGLVFDFGDLGLRSEWGVGRTAGVTSFGGYADLRLKVMTELEPALRLDLLRSDTSQDVGGYAVTLGTNVYLRGHKAKLQTNLTWLSGLTAPNGQILPMTMPGAGGFNVVIAAQGAL